MLKYGGVRVGRCDVNYENDFCESEIRHTAEPILVGIYRRIKVRTVSYFVVFTFNVKSRAVF